MVCNERVLVSYLVWEGRGGEGKGGEREGRGGRRKGRGKGGEGEGRVGAGGGWESSMWYSCFSHHVITLRHPWQAIWLPWQPVWLP